MLSAIEEYLRELVIGCGHGVQVIGRRDRLPVGLLDAIERVESATRDVAHSFLLRLAIDYSSRHAIVAAARAAAGVAGGPADLTVEAFARLLDPGSAGAAPDVDLLIRAGGEQRLSDFLLWECAYAELVFTSRLWPDFGAAELADALAEYRRRDRRFGRVARAAGAAT
jgi:undecaprenyl diphosphate synthase